MNLKNLPTVETPNNPLNNENNLNSESSFSINIFNKLKDKKSFLVMLSIRKYINEQIPEMIRDKFIENIEQISINIQDFILKKSQEFAKIWNIQYENNKSAFIEIVDALENLICKSLYDIIMNLENNDKTERNNIILNKFNFLNLKYLQVNIIIEEFEFQNKLKTLSEIGIYKSPKEKTILISNFCNYLKITYNITDSNTFLRVIVYSVIKLNIQNIYKNIKFTYFLRHKAVIDSDEDYYLSLFYSAFDFLEKLNFKKLAISKNEYQSHIDQFEKREFIKNPKLSNGDKVYEEKLLNYLNKSNVNINEESSYEKSDNSKEPKNNRLIKDLSIDGILNLNTEKLQNEYFSGNFHDINLTKFEKMHNDMKIILKMIEAHKSQMNSPSSQNHENSSSINNVSSFNPYQKENGINLIDL